MLKMLKEDITHTTIATTKCPLLLLLIKAQAALFRVSTPFLCARLLVFKKDGQDLEEVRKLELQGLSLV